MDLESLKHRFNLCYETESDSIFRFCLVRVSDREQALDITQEAFVRLWQTFVKGTSIHNERAFLFTITHRLIIDWYRKKKSLSLEAISKPIDDGGEGSEFGDGKGYADLEIEADGRSLLDKIRRLHSSNRHAVYLRFVEGLSPPEIAEILEISANNASVRINRGLKELRKIAGYDEKPN